MMFHRLLLSLNCLILLVLASGCAHFSKIPTIPTKYQQRLAKTSSWLTIASFDNAPGTFPPAETSVVKKWDTHLAPDGALIMREVSSSSFVGILDAVNRGRPLFREVELDGRVDPQAFFPYPGHALDRRRRFKADRYEFEDLGDKRFVIRINGGIGRIVFMPAPADQFTAGRPEDGQEVGIWSAPFGAESEIYAHLRRLLSKKQDQDESVELPPELEIGAFLHHDLTRQEPLPIVVDGSFPVPLRPAIERATGKWNEAMGKSVFAAKVTVGKIDVADCLSGRKLCIRWLGAKDLALTGANGYTELAFDPATGLVVGGVVTVINDDVKPPFKPLAPADHGPFGRLDRDWIAAAMLRYHEMNGVTHPEPLGYAEYVVLHEMGHFSGLGHNFYASDATTPSRPISTIMSYPPFPVAHRATYVGDADRQRLAMVYKGKGAAAGELPYCSTFEAMAPERDEQGYFVKAARCDIFTVGSPAEWYILIAKQGRAGVFTDFPDLSHLSDEMQDVYREVSLARRLPPLNVLTRFGFMLADASPANAKTKARVEGYLCSLRSGRTAIAAQLSRYHGVSLVCPDPES